MNHEVAIIGGGATGCAAAYFLKDAGVDRVCVIEPDPTYAKAATLKVKFRSKKSGVGRLGVGR